MDNKIFAAFSKNLTFQRQLGITVTLGIFFLAILSSIAGSWQSNERVSRDIIEHGMRITENLARQSVLALIFDSPDNVAEAAKTTLTFPEVVGVAIYHTDGHLLVAHGDNLPGQFLPPARQSGNSHAAILLDDTPNAWHFTAPVYSQPFADSPLAEAAAPELLGHVVVVTGKAGMVRLASDIFATNLTISFSFALFFLLLIRSLSRNMARPLDELSDSMERAQTGESQVRAKPGGPKDIAAMAHAFNDMMAVQEEREAALRESEEKYRTLVESALSIVLRWDTRGHIVYINHYAENLFGYQPDELIGEHVVGSIVPETESTSRDLSGLMSDILVHPENYRLNINENIKKSGERLWVMWTNRPIFDDTGKMIEILSIGNDITERKHAEDALTESMRQLEAKELAKSRFLAAAGHDLRQPLAAANLFIDTLKLTSPTPQQNGIIEHLDRSMSTFNGLLDTLLHVSKLDAGVIKPEFISIDVAEIFGWLEQNFAALTGEKQIDFRLRFPAKERLVVHSDIGLVNSVMMNLVSNAIKFTSNSPILVSARRRRNEVLFQVWDTGVGIPQEFIGQIFDEFYQIDNPQRDRTRGLGLGLSIVKRALALLNSEIGCRSLVGRGSVFEFSLPLDIQTIETGRRNDTETAPAETDVKSFVQDKRFVVLDDDMLVAQAMVALLEEMGGDVTCFHNPEDALLHPGIEHTDYFIVDYMLGNSLNGIQFLNRVRQKLGHPIRAVLMTGDTSAAFIREAASCDWPALHKPVNILRLKSALAAQTPPQN
ncbi:MAG TPA: ATP-binding protein [Gallionella sp.]|nr:ATP-binding protein [Gallionella sp.]